MLKTFNLVIFYCVIATAVFARSTDKKEVLSLSKGKYVEIFDQDSIEQIGEVLYNINSRQIVGFVTSKDSDAAVSLKPEIISRWLCPDPLAAKYPSISPYAFGANNPIRFIDPDGKDIVDPNNKHVKVFYNKDGSLGFGKNATSSIIRVANDLNMTESGRKQLNQIMGSDIHVKINISEEAKISKSGGKTSYQYGGTTQGDNNKDDNYGKFQRPDGTFGIKDATITIYEGTIKEAIKEGSGLKHEGLTIDQAIGAVAGHESVHATDKGEINKDISQEVKNGTERPDAQKEAKPVEVEQKIITESKQ